VSGSLGRNAAGHGDSPFETLATCLALIEIVNSCNLACPTCYANSPVRTGSRLDAVPIDNIQRRIQGVIDRKGGIEILQLSGGEPTLHPELFELLAWARDHDQIDYLLINTNGIRLANDPDFAARLGTMFEKGGLQIYLQFDGPHEAGQQTLRGADLRSVRLRAIEQCGKNRLPITLAMTVTSENLSQVWAAIEFGLGFSHVHGITFQPMFGSGRISTRHLLPAPPIRQAHSDGAIGRVADSTPEGLKNELRLNTGDILLSAVGHSGGRLRFEDFTPLPCGDPNCANDWLSDSAPGTNLVHQ
jgi:uncharacterized radical SAM superfamily Fe-S cluster-containing enzyme